MVGVFDPLPYRIATVKTSLQWGVCTVGGNLPTRWTSAVLRANEVLAEPVDNSRPGCSGCPGGSIIF